MFLEQRLTEHLRQGHLLLGESKEGSNMISIFKKNASSQEGAFFYTRTSLFGALT